MFRCAKCRKALPAESFRPNPKMKSGVHSWCKPCTVESTREWRHRNRDEIARRKREHYYANREAENARRMAFFRRSQPLTERNCLACGKTFVPDQRNSQTHCAPDCTTRRNRGRRIGITKHLRLKILKRDEYQCYLQPLTGCSGTIPPWLPWHHPLGPTVDHVIPAVAGGKGTPDNLRAAHWACNRWKAARLLEAA